jgi:hypothetical protein
MRYLKKPGLAVALALLAAGAGGAPASATTASPTGAGFTLTSTTVGLTVSMPGGGTVSCTDSSISGTLPTGTATTLPIKVNLAYSGCSLFGAIPASFTVPSNCRAAGANAITLLTMYNGASAPQAAAQLTIPAGCTITLHLPAIGCVLTIGGEQTLGNGTSGVGGMGWTNGNATTFSSLQLNAATVPSVVSHGGGAGCPSAGAHTGTLSGTYTVTSPTPAPGVTFLP